MSDSTNHTPLVQAHRAFGVKVTNALHATLQAGLYTTAEIGHKASTYANRLTAKHSSYWRGWNDACDLLATRGIAAFADHLETLEPDTVRRLNDELVEAHKRIRETKSRRSDYYRRWKAKEEELEAACAEIDRLNADLEDLRQLLAIETRLAA